MIMQYSSKLKGRAPIHAAVFCSSIEMIDLLVEYSANVDSCDDKGQSPLLNACESAKLHVVRALIRAGCDVNLSRNDVRRY